MEKLEQRNKEELLRLANTHGMSEEGMLEFALELASASLDTIKLRYTLIEEDGKPFMETYPRNGLIFLGELALHDIPKELSDTMTGVLGDTGDDSVYKLSLYKDRGVYDEFSNTYWVQILRKIDNYPMYAYRVFTDKREEDVELLYELGFGESNRVE